jgi:hypothetical protein
MAKRKPARTPTVVETPPARTLPLHLIPAAILVLAAFVFYWTPLTARDASIQWDAVDVHYTSQKYFADHIRQVILPQWTPYVFSGFPFLADPQVGAWYPPNWPFFLGGVAPVSIQWELVLHCLLAMFGAYLLAFHLLGAWQPAVLAGFCYGLSGFFAGHSSHVGIFQAAAWLPLIVAMLLKGRGAEAGLMVGAMALAGHFQTALYTGFAVVFLAGWRIGVRTLAVCGLVGLGISAVLVIPGLELSAQSIRASMDFRNTADGALVPAALATLVSPNALGALEGAYTGPADITQFYLYGGILLLPLAALGAWKSPTRMVAAAMGVPALWFAFGPSGGFFRLVALLPGLGSVRAPVHVWFVVALALALLAAGGLQWAMGRWPRAWLAPAVLLVAFVDLCYWNSANNPLAYARASFDDLYGSRAAQFDQRIAQALPPGTRFHAPAATSAFGPQNQPMESRVEATYGYNPLALRAYSEYLRAAEKNPRLLDTLGVRFALDPAQGGVAARDTGLPRAMFAAKVVRTGSLETHDPAQTVIADVDVAQAAGSTAQVVETAPGRYKIRYKCATPSLLRFAEAHFPGWQATVAGQAARVVVADHALIGVVVPAGEGDLILEYRLPKLGLGAAVSLLSLAVGVWIARRK